MTSAINNNRSATSTLMKNPASDQVEQGGASKQNNGETSDADQDDEFVAVPIQKRPDQPLDELGLLYSMDELTDLLEEEQWTIAACKDMQDMEHSEVLNKIVTVDAVVKELQGLFDKKKLAETQEKQRKEAMMSLAESSVVDEQGKKKKLDSGGKPLDASRIHQIERLLTDRRIRVAAKDWPAKDQDMSSRTKKELAKSYLQLCETNWELTVEAQNEIRKRVETLLADSSSELFFKRRG